MTNVFILLILLVTCGSPAIAQIRQENTKTKDEILLELKQVTKLLDEALIAKGSKDWVTACNKYNERTLYRQKNKLDLFMPIPKNATASEVSSIHRTNITIGKLNGMTNEMAEDYCGKAGMKAVLNTAEVVYEGVYIPVKRKTSDIRIFTNCRKKWGDDYRMIKFCFEEQTKARNSLGL